MRILIADQLVPSRKALISVLRIGNSTTEIIERASLDETLALLHQANIDCAFIDESLTEPNTIQILASLRNDNITTPIILTGPERFEPRIVELIKAGASDYLVNTQLSAEMVLHALRQAIRLALANRDTRQAQSAVREREIQKLKETEKLEAIIRNSPIAITTTSIDGIVIAWNPSCERLFGWTAAETLGNKIPIVGLNEAEFQNNRKAVMAGQVLENVEVTRIRRDGTAVQLSLCLYPIMDDSGTILSITAMYVDITESHKLRDQLIQSQRLESIGRLASGVAHDFNNLLAVITGYTDALLRKTQPENPQHEHIQHIALAAERGATLTRQLLTFSRGRSIKPQIVNLNEALQPIHEMLVRVIGRDYQFKLTLGENVRPIAVDSGQLEQVLFNLALNARDAMPEGGEILIETASVLRHDSLSPSKRHRRNRWVRLSVTDSGIGMDEATASHIFEPFFTTKDRKGTGLGLWIVYSILQGCNAQITVRSKPDHGTTFDIFFPAEKTSNLPVITHIIKDNSNLSIPDQGLRI